MALIACEDCGKQVSDKAATCIQCGRPIRATSASAAAWPMDHGGDVSIEVWVASEKKSTLVAYLLLLCFGSTGAHNFYLERKAVAFFQLACLLLEVVLACIVGVTQTVGEQTAAMGLLLVFGLVFLASLISLVVDLVVIPGVVARHTAELRRRFAAEQSRRPTSGAPS